MSFADSSLMNHDTMSAVLKESDQIKPETRKLMVTMQEPLPYD